MCGCEVLDLEAVIRSKSVARLGYSASQTTAELMLKTLEQVWSWWAVPV